MADNNKEKEEEQRKKIVIAYKTYNRISDHIMFLSDNWVMNFAISFRRKDRKNNNGEIYYYEEVEYTDRLTGEKRVKIRRNFKYFLSMEQIQKDESGNKDVVCIYMDSMYSFTTALNYIINIINTNGVFKYINGIGYTEIDNSVLKETDYYLPNGADNPKRYIYNPFGNDMRVDVAISRKSGNSCDIGCRIYYTERDSIFIKREALLNLLYFLSTFNMYQTACTMLNFMGIPPEGCVERIRVGNNNNINHKNNEPRFLK